MDRKSFYKNLLTDLPNDNGVSITTINRKTKNVVLYKLLIHYSNYNRHSYLNSLIFKYAMRPDCKSVADNLEATLEMISAELQ
jgi:hypothetical protein